jgi:predicted nucleic acid-binding protein
VPDAIVLDASAAVEALIGTQVGIAVRARMQGRSMHAPGHLDAEVLSALGRLHRAGHLSDNAVAVCLEDLIAAPIIRHPVLDLLQGAWRALDRFRLVDGIYVALSNALGIPLLTTDGRLARAYEQAEMVQT